MNTFQYGVNMKDKELDTCETFMNENGTYITICSTPRHKGKDGETVIFHG